ncbi:hypothetical protein JCM8097_002108 [Rhodosporidiobolus ruineniae]
MLFRTWDRFTAACIELCGTGDKQTRACLRWKHDVGLLVIRVTDDQRTLTFKARSTVYLNRFDILNRTLLARYQNRRRSAHSLPDATTATSRATAVPAPTAASGDEVPASLAQIAGGANSAGKAKKKKAKKAK